MANLSLKINLLDAKALLSMQQNTFTTIAAFNAEDIVTVGVLNYSSSQTQV